MTRLIGAGLIGLAGFLAAGELTGRIDCTVKTLYSMIGALDSLRRDLATRAPPFEELFAAQADRADAAGAFFAALTGPDERPLRKRWEAGLHTHLPALSADARRILESLGSGLGQSMEEEQLRLLDGTLEALRTLYTREEARAAEQTQLLRRLCPGIAAAAALMLL